MKSQHYSGRGRRRSNAVNELPVVDPMRLRAPEDYRASPELAAAVDVALILGMPLLLTGEPGSGKSGLADSLAWELGMEQGPLRFVIKSDTQARDLFYRFDTVGRFHAAQTEDSNSDPCNFISFEALGSAILHAKSSDYVHKTLRLPKSAVHHPGSPRRSVVLIDEIDKAPRDVPNDILVEIERLQFTIPEFGNVNEGEDYIGLDDAENAYRPIIIITSNSEKALPDPFLRRCVFHHVEFPPFHDQEGSDRPREDKTPGESKGESKDRTNLAGKVTIEDIVASRLGKRYAGQGTRFVEQALSLFRYIREQARGVDRRPTLAELLDWLNYLLPQTGEARPAKSLLAIDEEQVVGSLKNLLLKTPNDQARATELWQAWKKAAKPSLQG